MEHQQLIRQCVKGDRKAQRAIFDMFSGKMYYVCLRYAIDESEAQDMLQEGFIRLFKHLNGFKGEGSFEGWARRIFVHTAIKYYHKMRKHNGAVDLNQVYDHSIDATVIDSMSQQEVLALVKRLPEGYQIVFNMYAIEGYSHKDIASKLNIKESTSRSQLVKARKLLQTQITQLQTILT